MKYRDWPVRIKMWIPERQKKIALYGNEFENFLTLEELENEIFLLHNRLKGRKPKEFKDAINSHFA